MLPFKIGAVPMVSKENKLPAIGPLKVLPLTKNCEPLALMKLKTWSPVSFNMEFVTDRASLLLAMINMRSSVSENTEFVNATS